ncbi:MAG: DUF4339 domain-containing protein [Armatimonadetes bacterium]|nr:DUF4339 domain-containing protein [Armatimonadota bacterium]
MGDQVSQPEWYYVGHYGQLGPLTFDQVQELARDGVIAPDTFVWRPGMGDWRPARDVSDLRPLVQLPQVEFVPPPMPGAQTAVRPEPRMPQAPAYASPVYATSQWSYLESTVPKSDKSRTVAGLLNLMPGIGRFYLGYAAHGVLQLFTAFFCGIGFVWSIIDGIYILMGGVKYDGYGRTIED